MKFEEISSKENKLLKHIQKLEADGKYRRTNGEYVCEGEKLLYEAIRDGVELHAVVWEKQSLESADIKALDLLADSKCRMICVNESIYKSINILENYKGALFVCAMPVYSDHTKPGRYIALDGVQDPGNVGTMIRVADAFRIDGLWLLDGCADPYQPKAARAAMGSLFRTKIIKSSTDEFFKRMKDSNVPVYATALHENSREIGEISLSCAAVVIGSEGHGVSQTVIEKSEGTIIIPMPGRAESLNAAVAGSIVMWEMSKCL